MRMKKQWLWAAPAMLMLAAPSFAQYSGNSTQISSFLSGTTSWILSYLGPGLFVIGLMIVGISMAMGNEDAVRKGACVIGGGIIMFLASPIVSLLKGLTGN